MRICLDSVHGIQRSVPVDLCIFFHTCVQGGWFLVCYPLFRILSRLFFPLKGCFFWFVLIVCLSEEKLIFIGEIRGRFGHFNGCCLDILPDSETYLLRDFEFQFGVKMSHNVDWSGDVCFFEVELQYIVTCVPQCWWNCFRLEKTCDRLVI